MRQSILKAALDLASKQRYDRVTKADIAARAGCGTGTVNKYFKDMPGLRDAVMAEAVATGQHDVVAQGLVDRHPAVMAAPEGARLAALAALGG